MLFGAFFLLTSSRETLVCLISLSLIILIGLNYWFIPGDVNVVAQTVFLAGVVLIQIGNTFACRTSKAHNTQMGWGKQ